MVYYLLGESLHDGWGKRVPHRESLQGVRLLAVRDTIVSCMMLRDPDLIETRCQVYLHEVAFLWYEVLSKSSGNLPIKKIAYHNS
jgi:hypothetical protein